MVNAQLLEPPPAPVKARLWFSVAMLVVAVGVAFFGLRGHLPSAAETWGAMRGADPLWVFLAVALHGGSLLAFAEQERRLLGAFDVRMPLGRAFAVTLARSAMTMGLPGGSALAAAYGFQQFRARGATKAVAGAVTVLCGVTSVSGLALLYAGHALLGAGAIYVAGAAVAATALVLLARGLRWRPAPSAEPAGKVRRMIRETAVLAAEVPARRWVTVLALAVVNWLGDLLCLLVCLRAVGLDMPFPAVAAAFLGVQLARQIPFTAGGIGVVEAGLIVALTTLGGAPAAVTAAALIYRVLTCWAMLPLGAAAWAALRSRPA